ncbi:MAG: hypothetical protein KF681_09080 [Bdellovibrionaceae bacterium]|nr:hypothetical protein [Pseudobdellovibrionaceae bacterium]
MNRTTLIGSVLMMILTTGTVSANPAQEQEAAAVVNELIAKGYLKIDKDSGRILIKRSIYDILKDQNVVAPRGPFHADMDPISKSTAKCNMADVNAHQVSDDIGIKTTGRCETI